MTDSTPTPKPLVAGVLSIVAGVSAVIGGIVLALLGLIGTSAITAAEPDSGPVAFIPAAFFLPLALLILIIAGFSIVGGIESIQRRRWWLAIIGSIAATLALPPLGVAAIVLVILSEKEFLQAVT